MKKDGFAVAHIWTYGYVHVCVWEREKRDTEREKNERGSDLLGWAKKSWMVDAISGIYEFPRALTKL